MAMKPSDDDSNTIVYRETDEQRAERRAIRAEQAERGRQVAASLGLPREERGGRMKLRVRCPRCGEIVQVDPPWEVDGHGHIEATCGQCGGGLAVNIDVELS